ncbi:hypothetical protein PAGU2196_50370 [Pseudomonas sp. PAGU 2196]|uniref:hypothetical protein n=1 Tax=Pseudomonas sp. PAGU 2196 TaxID=2793997 RepID=UPI001EDD65C7|nr:hypothetical protein [Pseudomonas sp. PAGU 2196]GHS84203.1 hypothetical protein PAGU2196_50370 [Pseudomonas sp. PAGU 2196]
MNSLSALPHQAQPLTPTQSTSALASNATPIAGVPTIPSTSVTLGENTTVNDSETYSRLGLLSGQVRYAWEVESQDKLTSTLQTAFEASRTSGRFKGIGAALIEQLAQNGGKNVSQSVFAFNDRSLLAPAELALQQQQLRETPDNGVSFSLTTSSGATIRLLLASGANGLAVSAEVEGETLSDEELKGLGNLADSFQSTIDGLHEAPPQLKLGALVRLDPKLFTSLEMTAKLETPSGEQTFALMLDDHERSISLKGPSGQVQLSLDTRNSELLGSSAQRKAATDNYLTQFDAAQNRGRGDKNLMNILKVAFTQLNSIDDNRQAAVQRPSPLNDKDRALLSGLADFKASISESVNRINPMRQDEVDSFTFNTSQTTTIKGSALRDLSVEQTQTSKLNASFHRSLNPMTELALSNDRKSQNYTYHLIEDQASSITRLAYDEGRLVEASASQQASQKERILSYMNGDLKSDLTTPKSVTQSRNVLNLLEEAFRQDRTSQQKLGVSLLDDLLQSQRSRWGLQADPSKISA